MTRRGRGVPIASAGYDDYTTLLRAGSASDYAKSIGLEQVPWWNKLTEHPAYDALWPGQALDKLLAPVPLKIPTMWLQRWWDPEDIYVANHAYAALEGQERGKDRHSLGMGRWRPSQLHGERTAPGPPHGDGDAPPSN